MKIDIKKIDSGEDEIILRYKEVTPKIKRILDALNGESNRLVGRKDDKQVVVDTGEILYIESVDDKTFAYTESDVVRVDNTLQGITEALDDIKFFRCSKSMIINVDKVRVLKSLSSNRIDATLENGEHILISRTYASDFRKLLKGGAPRE
ncbi:MAG: LytTR family transcriptional regulator DNA-binding domain-containing protein [Lachnospiraceae bacterium]|nr:LytTR family transcriptional regulator DNA-binding domain-containing protein [Lachnospiraceae bacterium]